MAALTTHSFRIRFAWTPGGMRAGASDFWGTVDDFFVAFFIVTKKQFWAKYTLNTECTGDNDKVYVCCSRVQEEMETKPLKVPVFVTWSKIYLHLYKIFWFRGHAKLPKNQTAENWKKTCRQSKSPHSITFDSNFNHFYRAFSSWGSFRTLWHCSLSLLSYWASLWSSVLALIQLLWSILVGLTPHKVETLDAVETLVLTSTLDCSISCILLNRLWKLIITTRRLATTLLISAMNAGWEIVPLFPLLCWHSSSLFLEWSQTSCVALKVVTIRSIEWLAVPLPSFAGFLVWLPSAYFTTIARSTFTTSFMTITTSNMVEHLLFWLLFCCSSLLIALETFSLLLLKRLLLSKWTIFLISLTMRAE